MALSEQEPAFVPLNPILTAVARDHDPPLLRTLPWLPRAFSVQVTGLLLKCKRLAFARKVRIP